MAMRSIKSVLGACAAAAALLSAAPASADVTWYVTGKFDDGGTLSGFFTVNVYGYLSAYDLLAGPGTLHNSDFEYTPATSYKSNTISPPFFLNAWDKDPPYKGGLQLQFQNALLAPADLNPIVTNLSGAKPSWECRDSWVCPTAGAPATRYLVSGRASTDAGLVPEPGTWALMLLGFGAMGGALRSRRRAAA